jgi:hypothetical protein
MNYYYDYKIDVGENINDEIKVVSLKGRQVLAHVQLFVLIRGRQC